MEKLTAWENWTGSNKEFYAMLGFTHAQMTLLIGKAKRLKREGHFVSVFIIMVLFWLSYPKGLKKVYFQIKLIRF